MQTIHVRTTQNVFIQYPLGSVGDRILGYLIDLLVLIIYTIAVVALLINIKILEPWAYIISLGFPWLFYKALFEIFMDGQTPGKRLMNIKVVRIDGTPATLGDFVVRWIFGLVEYYIMNGLIALLCVTIGGKGQRLGDMVAGTTVVKLIEQKEISAKQVFVSAEESYQPIFPQAIQLNPHDVELIQRALEVNRDHDNPKPLLAVTEKIKTQLGIQTDLPSIKFLYVLVKDYNHLTSR